jgi:hypothetical protein
MVAIMTKINCLAIAREYFPSLSDGELNEILFCKTGYPSFFLADDIEPELRKQLADYAEAKRQYPDKRLCDFCNTPALEERSLCAEHAECFEEKMSD